MPTIPDGPKVPPDSTCGNPQCAECGAPIDKLDVVIGCLFRIEELLEMLVGVDSEAEADEARPGGSPN